VGHALNALRAVTPLGDQVAMEIAVENLESRDPQQRANAIETVEAVGEPGVVRPLLAVWETSPDRADHWSAIEQLLADDDPWVRACAAFVAGGSSDGRLRPAVADLATADPDTLVREVAGRTLKGGMAVETLATLSLMDRIVALRKVPLFRELSPDDLRHVAETAAEHLYPDGSVLAEQGDPGDAMHVVVTGEVRVLMGEKAAGAVEVARRGPGYIVGEMAILSEEPRMASLVASGDVRTLSIDRPRFRRIVQERPDMALAVMRELCSRLREAHALGTPSTTG
jgi:HEAT repeat protein